MLAAGSDHVLRPRQRRPAIRNTAAAQTWAVYLLPFMEQDNPFERWNMEAWYHYQDASVRCSMCRVTFALRGEAQTPTSL